jgi:hypothetical protein
MQYRLLTILLLTPATLLAQPDRASLLQRYALTHIYSAPTLSPLEKDALDRSLDLVSSPSASPALKKWVERRLDFHRVAWASRLSGQEAAAPRRKAPRGIQVAVFPGPRPLFRVEIPGAPGPVHLTVHDLSGRLLLQSGVPPSQTVPGLHEYVWDASGEPAGVYSYVVTAETTGDPLHWKGLCLVSR